MCPINGNIVQRNDTTRVHDFRRKTVAPRIRCTLTNRSMLYYYTVVTGRSKVGTASAPQRLDFPRAVLYSCRCIYLKEYEYHCKYAIISLYRYNLLVYGSISAASKFTTSVEILRQRILILL